MLQAQRGRIVRIACGDVKSAESDLADNSPPPFAPVALSYSANLGRDPAPFTGSSPNGFFRE